MSLLKGWLTNKNVVICNDTLSDIHKFAVTAHSPVDVQKLAAEVVQAIPDKARFFLPVTVNYQKLNTFCRPS